MNDIDFIEKAFAKRERPQAVRDMSRPADEIYSDADAFAGKDWREVTCARLEKHYNATSGFSPEAFCYYLPGIYVAGMREGRPDLLVNDALIIGLDRGNAPASWDDFFRDRWPRLTPQECEQVLLAGLTALVDERHDEDAVVTQVVDDAPGVGGDLSQVRVVAV
jgi:hypothetical protein